MIAAIKTVAVTMMIGISHESKIESSKLRSHAHKNKVQSMAYTIKLVFLNFIANI